MDHHRTMGVTILADILQLEILRLHKVELDRRALPLAAQGVAHHKIHLWTIESRLANTLTVLDTAVLQGSAQRTLSQLPDLIAAHVVLFLIWIAQRKANPVVIEAVGIEDLQRQIDSAVELFLNLVGAQKDMSIILRQAAHARQTRQYARLLVAVERREFSVANRQLTVAM